MPELSNEDLFATFTSLIEGSKANLEEMEPDNARVWKSGQPLTPREKEEVRLLNIESYQKNVSKKYEVFLENVAEVVKIMDSPPVSQAKLRAKLKVLLENACEVATALNAVYTNIPADIKENIAATWQAQALNELAKNGFSLYGDLILDEKFKKSFLKPKNTPETLKALREAASSKSLKASSNAKTYRALSFVSLLLLVTAPIAPLFYLKSRMDEAKAEQLNVRCQDLWKVCSSAKEINEGRDEGVSLSNASTLQQGIETKMGIIKDSVRDFHRLVSPSPQQHKPS